jgi:hypothetical protein
MKFYIMLSLDLDQVKPEVDLCNIAINWSLLDDKIYHNNSRFTGNN